MTPLLLLSPLAYARPLAADWTSLKDGLDAWAALDFESPFGVSAGDATGALFRWESRNFSLDATRMAGASLSKWPAAVMVSGLVANGTLAFDDLASKHLPWWTTDASDSRSRVTLRHLLSFTSGWTADPAFVPKCSTYLDCAEKLYHAAQKGKHHSEPGTTWSYLSIHLQLAGAVAVAASGRDIQSLFAAHLYAPFNMTRTDWSGGAAVPQMATGITTVGADFEHLLTGLLSYSGLPKAVQDGMEVDYSQPPVEPSGDGWFGHYAMGHWWECVGYGTPDERAPLPQSCLDAHIQAGPGAFGYYPLLDRSGGGGDAGPSRPPMWFQIALQEPFGTSGIPEYLRLITKPVADLVIGGHDADAAPRADVLAQGGGLLRRDIDYIASELGDCTCSKKPFAKGEPFKTLTKGLPADKPKKNRRQLAKQGEGVLLREIAEMQKELGTCRCSGRDAARAAAPARPSPADLSQTVILIRHGEKDGGDDLDARGYTRAYCLASKYVGATHLYAYTDKDTRRPVETLTPLAGALGLAVDTSVHRDDVDALAASIAALPSDAVVVVAWEHSVLSDVAAALGVRNPPDYPSDEFDWQWTVRHGQLTQANEKC